MKFAVTNNRLTKEDVVTLDFINCTRHCDRTDVKTVALYPICRLELGVDT